MPRTDSRHVGAGVRPCSAVWHVDVVFIVLGLALFAAWMGEAERRVRLGATDAAAR